MKSSILLILLFSVANLHCMDNDDTDYDTEVTLSQNSQVTDPESSQNNTENPAQQ